MVHCVYSQFLNKIHLQSALQTSGRWASHAWSPFGHTRRYTLRAK